MTNINLGNENQFPIKEDVIQHKARRKSEADVKRSNLGEVQEIYKLQYRNLQNG